MYIFMYIETVENTLQKRINMLKRIAIVKGLKNVYITARESVCESEAKSLLDFDNL